MANERKRDLDDKERMGRPVDEDAANVADEFDEDDELDEEDDTSDEDEP